MQDDVPKTRTAFRIAAGLVAIVWIAGGMACALTSSYGWAVFQFLLAAEFASIAIKGNGFIFLRAVACQTQQQQQTDESKPRRPTLKGTITGMIVAAALFGYSGYSGIEFTGEDRTAQFVVFLVLATVLFIAGSVGVWRTQGVSTRRRFGFMAALLLPLILGSTVFVVGGFEGSPTFAIIGAVIGAVLFAVVTFVVWAKSRKRGQSSI